MKKKALLDYFTIHPNSINSLGVIVAVLLTIAITQEPLVLFALLVLPLLPSQQIVPQEQYEPESDDSDDEPSIGFTADIE